MYEMANAMKSLALTSPEIAERLRCMAEELKRSAAELERRENPGRVRRA